MAGFAQPQIDRRTLLAGVGGLSLAALLAACGGSTGSGASAPSAPAKSWDEVVAAGQKEGEVVFYTTTNQDLLDKLIPAFEKKYPIKVTLFRAGGPDLPPRLQQEIKANAWKPDIVSVSDPIAFEQFNKAGYVNTNPGVPEAANWPAEYFKDGAGQMQLVLTTIAYNTKLIPADQVPKDWSDVLDPKWKDKLAILEPVNVTFNNSYEFLRNKFGDDFLAKLKDQNPKFYNSGNPMLDAVAAGQYPLCLFTYIHYVSALQAQGAPVQWVHTSQAPAYGGYVWVAPDAHSQHPNAAKVLLNYILSAEGQLSYLGKGGGNSAINVPGTIPLPPDGAFFPDENTSQDDIDTNRKLLGLKAL
jgi:iron(III) transport system substrate-binding protein